METPSDADADGKTSSKPKQASRSVSLLTQEQLIRKRAQDRESQRQTRLRVKQTIAELERRVEDLTKQLIAAKLENDSLKEENQLPFPGSLPQTLPPDIVPAIDHSIVYPGTEVIAQRRNFSTVPYVPPASPFSQSLMVQGPAVPGLVTELPEGLNLNPNLFTSYANEGFVQQQPISIGVWEVLPCHYPPTCRFDQIFFDLVEAQKSLGLSRGNDFEFHSTNFPSVAALLNPRHYAATYPLATTIAASIIYSFSIENLPEQFAIMYIFCIMSRWYITRSKEDYYALPEFMRPTSTQLVTAHPLWVDMLPWPKARDKVCQNLKFHDTFEEFSHIANDTISINWPYNPADCLVSSTSKEVTINPVFIQHVRDMNNWTYGPSFLKSYPELEGGVRIGRPRLGFG